MGVERFTQIEIHANMQFSAIQTIHYLIGTVKTIEGKVQKETLEENNVELRMFCGETESLSDFPN